MSKQILCLICKQYKSRRAFTKHLLMVHNITAKEYYDKFLKEPGEGKCIICGKPTKFYGLGEKNFGYAKYCSAKCSLQDPEIQKKRNENIRKAMNEKKDEIRKKYEETCMKKYGVKNVSQAKEVREKLSSSIKKAYKEKGDEIKEKYKKTCQEKYGTDSVLQNKEIRNKIKETNKKKYGVEVPTQSKKVKDKISKTYKEIFKDEEKKKEILNKRRNALQEKYGVDNIMELKEYREKLSNVLKKKYENDKIKNKVIEKRKNTMMEKYGVSDANQLEGIRDKIMITRLLNQYNLLKEKINLIMKEKDFVFPNNLKDMIYDKTKRIYICNNCKKQHTFESFALSSFKCSCRKETYIEKMIKDILDEYDVNYIQWDRKQIHPYELDFYLPDYNIGIEVHGLYWHSEVAVLHEFKLHEYSDINNILKITNSNEYKDKRLKFQKSILTKTNLAIEKNIKIIHIFEDEIVNKYNIVKSRILYLLNKIKNKIGARQCTIKEIDAKTCNEFLKDNHIQGKDNAPIRLGLYYQNELVSVMTFNRPSLSKNAENKKDTYELSRFCNKTNLNVIGSANKLLKYFINKYNPNHIFTYSDLRWNTGNLYETLGFKFTKWTGQGYWYTDFNIRIHRFNLRKTENDMKELSEWILRMIEGYYRIWDIGNNRYDMIINNDDDDDDDDDNDDKKDPNGSNDIINMIL